MSNYHIGSINAQNAVVGDHNTQVNIDDQLANLNAEIERHASTLPDAAAARHALNALRRECAAHPPDANRIRRAVGELTAATAKAPAIHHEIAQVIGHITDADIERHP